jgi:hypothetical protein
LTISSNKLYKEVVFTLTNKMTGEPKEELVIESEKKNKVKEVLK